MKQVYQAKFEDDSTVSFYVNDLSGYFYGELWINNPQQITDNEFIVANTYEFKDESLEGFMNQVRDFLKKRFDTDFTISKK